MARLNQIEIRESDATYSNQRDWFFHPTGHHVGELLLHFLPRDYVLDGSSKFCAVFGPREPGEELNYEILGVRVCCVDPFDVEAYRGLPIEEQQEVILSEIASGLRETARLCGADLEPLNEAEQAVRSHRFRQEIPIEKLSRSTRDRRLRVNVYRILSPERGESWEARVISRDGTTLEIVPITETWDCLDRTEQFRKARWVGAEYQLIDTSLDEVEFSLDVDKFDR